MVNTASEVIQSSDRLRILAELSLLDSPAEAAFDRLTKLASKILNTPMSLVSLVDSDRQFFKSQVGLAEPWASLRESPLSHSFCQYAVITGRPFIVDNATENSLVQENLAIPDMGVIAYAGIPLFCAGQALGSFCVIDTQARHWTDEEIDILQELAASAITELELRHELMNHRRTEAELRESQKFIQQITDTVPDIIYVFDFNEQYNIYLNQKISNILGYEIEEIQAMGDTVLQRLVHPDDLERVMKYQASLMNLSNGEIAENEYRMRHANGEWRWLYSREAVFKRDEDGTPIQILGVVGNTTERREIAEKLAQERNLLRILIDHLPDYIYAKDTSSRFTIANKVTAMHLGAASPDEIIGKTDFDFSPPEFAEQYLADEKMLFQTGEALIGKEEPLYDHATSSEKWILTTKIPLRDSDGNIIGLVGANRDITERKAAQDKLRESEERFRAISEASPFGIFLTDADGNCIYTNQFYQQITGLSFQQALIDGWKSAIHPEDRENVLSAWEEAARSKSPFEGVYRYQHRDGITVWTSVKAVKIQDSEAIVGYLGTVEDITSRKLMQEKLAQERTLLRTLIDNLPDYIFAKDTEGKFLISNKAHAQAVRVTDPEAMVGKTAYECWPQELAAQYEIDDRLVIQSGRTLFNLERVSINAEGEHIWVSTTKAPLKDADGHIIGLVGMSRDITERKQVEESLSKHVEQLSTLQRVDAELNHRLNTSYVLSMALDAAVRLSQANHGFIAFEEDGSFVVQESVGSYPKGFVLDQDRSITKRVIHSEKAELITDVSQDPDYYEAIEGTQAQITIPLISQERFIGILNLETNKAEHFTEEVFEFLKLVTARVAVAVDNAQLYQTMQDQLHELQALYERVSKLEQIKTDMIRLAAHDLRNPIGVIGGYVQLLQMELGSKATAQVNEYIDYIGRATKRMEKIANDILSLQRIEASQNNVREAVNLRDMVTAVFEEYREQAAQKAQQFELTLVDKPVFIQGDPGQLREAIHNLISNAVKYTPMSGRIDVKLVQENERVIFEVVDTGFGIPEDQHTKLFQPFFRVKNRETKNIEGTGLGLHLVKNIVERNGGTLRFESVHGKGSTFGFELPVFQGEAQS